MDAEVVDQVRRFNRTVTQRIGALEDEFLARGRPLGHSRLLWEIGEDGTEVRRLRAQLGLDSGYVSRMLRSLERDGLVATGPSPADRRVRAVRLTRQGLAERAELDRRSDAAAAALLEPLTGRQRARLAAAMAEVEAVLLASMVHVAAADPPHPDARRCLRSYFEELAARFDGGFDPARSNRADDAEMTAPAGLFVLASLRGAPVGCGAVKFHLGAPAEIKRMWVAPAARGLGVGRRILACLEERARAAGATAARLETNGALTEAIAMYRSADYVQVAPFNAEPYAHYWFEKPL